MDFIRFNLKRAFDYFSIILEYYKRKTIRAPAKMEPKKLFNKVLFFQRNGLMQRRFNYETNTFDSSLYLHISSYIKLFIKTSVPLKLVVSLFFERTSLIQLWVGNPYKLVGLIIIN